MDQVCRLDGDPAARRAAQGRGPLPKPAAAGAQRLFENGSVLGFGAAAMLRGPALQRFDDIPGNISDKQLRDESFLGCHP